MNQHEDLDRMLGAWLDDPLTLPAPGYLGEVLEQTRQMRQRPSWASLERWLPMTIALRRSVVPAPALLTMLGLLILLAVIASLSLVPLLGGVVAPNGGDVRPGLIAFSRDGDIYLVEASPDAEPRAIVSGPDEDAWPLWSPDGRAILFSRMSDEGEMLMVTDADGSTPLALLQAPARDLRSIQWAPDSKSLVLATGEAALPGSASDGGYGIVVLAADGSGEQTQLGLGGSGPRPGISDVAWRPGSGDRVDLLYRQAGDPAVLIYAKESVPDASGDARLSGGILLDAEQMAGVRTTSFGGEYDFWGPAWSPDGERFAYSTLNDVDGAPDGNGFRVHVASESTGGAPDRILEFDPQSDDDNWPVWSPDGSRIAFQSYDGGTTRVVLMPVLEDAPADPSSGAVASEEQITADPGVLAYAWAPDASALVVVNTAYQRLGAQLMDAETGTLEPLGWSTTEWPSWQPTVSD